jgi:hypothetical protein
MNWGGILLTLALAGDISTETRTAIQFDSLFLILRMLVGAAALARAKFIFDLASAIF